MEEDKTISDWIKEAIEEKLRCIDKSF